MQHLTDCTKIFVAFCAKSVLKLSIICANIQIVARDATYFRKRGVPVKVNLLKSKLVALGMNVEQLASAIKIDRSSLYRKLNNAEKITIGEATRIKEALSMTDEEATQIFLS